MEIVDGAHLLRCKYCDIGLGIGILIGKSITMIDSGVSSTFQDEILPYLRKIGSEPRDVSLVVNTHGHQDHMGGNAILREACHARVAAHKLDIPWIEDLERLFDYFHRKNSAYIPVTEETRKAFYLEGGRSCPVNISLSEGDILEADGKKLRVIHTPGHSPGSICLYEETNRILFTGDAVQGLGVRSEDFKSLPLYADFRAYLQSLQRLDNLNVQMLIAAHPYKPFRNMILRHGEIHNILSQSKGRTNDIHQFITELLEKGPKPMDLGDVTRKVCVKFLSLEMISVNALTTVNAHLKELERMGGIRLKTKRGRTMVEG
jgi:glyoxylase-like metal-dependent hydrolase (beta-lactamase superfamily II)